MNKRELIISGVHMHLTEALKETVHTKAEKLFNHEERIIRIRIELEYQSHKKTNHDEYIAKGHIEIDGPSLVVSEATDNLYTSIDQMIIKLDRKLRQRSRLRKVKRKNVHTVDIPAELPKTKLI